MRRVSGTKFDSNKQIYKCSTNLSSDTLWTMDTWRTTLVERRRAYLQNLDRVKQSAKDITYSLQKHRKEHSPFGIGSKEPTTGKTCAAINDPSGPPEEGYR
jgi:hypothetical protein